MLNTKILYMNIENEQLFPRSRVQPIEIGDSYRDYWLSDVVKSHGAFVKFAKVGCHWNCEWVRSEIKIGRMTEGEWEFLWRGDLFSPDDFVVHPEAWRFIEEEGAHNWTDLRLRYFLNDDGSLSFPRCVAARHIWDYVEAGKHVDALVDFATGEYYWIISSL